MGAWSRLRAFLVGRREAMILAPRRERREAARRRHHTTGEPAWTPADRHLGPEGERLVADVVPGTPGHMGSVRSLRDD
jgi:hypothetical protein